MINKIILLNKKPNNNPILIISILIIITIVTISFKLDTYDTYKIVGINECTENCLIKTNLPYSKTSILSENPTIIYKNEKYKINNIVYNDIFLDNNIPYQEILIETEIEENTKLMELKISYNKQRIIDKILNILKGD